MKEGWRRELTRGVWKDIGRGGRRKVLDRRDRGEKESEREGSRWMNE